LAASNGEARRLISQGAVQLDDQRVSAMKVPAPRAAHAVLRAGKRRYLRLNIEQTGTA